MDAKIRLWVISGLVNRIFGLLYIEMSAYGALILYKYANSLGLGACIRLYGVAMDIWDLRVGWPAARVKAENISAKSL